MEQHSESAIGYLKSTEPALIHLFNGLDAYDLNPPPSIWPYIDSNGKVQMSKSVADKFVQAHLEFLSLEFARATLSGSILQIAYMALKQYSVPTGLTREAESFGINSKRIDLTRFCLGRKVHEIPIGLLIYAGRIHYNHWDEGEPINPVAKSVFAKLYHAYIDDLTFDMAYDLNYPAPRPIAHYILRLELQWKSYEDYVCDMKNMLNLTM